MVEESKTKAFLCIPRKLEGQCIKISIEVFYFLKGDIEVKQIIKRWSWDKNNTNLRPKVRGKNNKKNQGQIWSKMRERFKRPSVGQMRKPHPSRGATELQYWELWSWNRNKKLWLNIFLIQLVRITGLHRFSIKTLIGIKSLSVSINS